MTEFEKKTGEIPAQSPEATTEFLDTIRCGVYRYLPDLTTVGIFDIDDIRGEVYKSNKFDKTIMRDGRPVKKDGKEVKEKHQFLVTLMKPEKTQPSILSAEDHDLLADENSVIIQDTIPNSKGARVLAEAAFNTEKDEFIYADENGVLAIEDGETSITIFGEEATEQSVLQSASEFSVGFRQSAPEPVFKARRREQNASKADKAAPVGSVATGSEVRVATG